MGSQPNQLLCRFQVHLSTIGGADHDGIAGSEVALVAGATRGTGRGIAVQLGAAGATVYVTGRTSQSKRSEMNRPETIEETATLVDEAGGRGIAVQVDHRARRGARAGDSNQAKPANTSYSFGKNAFCPMLSAFLHNAFGFRALVGHPSYKSAEGLRLALSVDRHCGIRVQRRPKTPERTRTLIAPARPVRRQVYSCSSRSCRL